jgi:hypothetical protein
MKKILLTAAAVLVSVSVFAQGELTFGNLGALGPDAPITAPDGATRLEGSGYMAQLYAGPAGTAEGSLTAVGAAVAFATGAGAGYWAPATRQIASVAPGANAAVQVRAWDVSSGSSWETATVRGESNILDPFQLGGGSAGPPTAMIGLQSFSLVPEPSTIALGLIGAVALVFARRRK